MTAVRFTSSLPLCMTFSTMSCPINWISTNSKDPRYMEGRGKRKGRTFKVIPLPPEIDRATMAGRSQWKDVGKNQQIRRMFISGGISMFAEAMRPCLEKHHGRVLSSFSEVVNKSIPFWDKLAEIDREGWAARARIEKKSDHYIYIRKTREKGCGEREVLSLQLSDCESDPDELPGQICDVQSVERHMEMLERSEPENSTSQPGGTCRPVATSEEITTRQEPQTPAPPVAPPVSVSPREENFVRVRMAAPPQPVHRAEVLYNKTPTDRGPRFEKEAAWRGRTISTDQTRRFNRCTGGFRDAALIQGSQW
uniref:Protein FAM43A n=2 Tax=Haemonchus contortus TaxID=6289 RepID=A0A7I4XTU1_HAECO